MMLYRDDRIKEKQREIREVKLALLPSPNFDPGRLFPEYFKQDKPSGSLKDSDDEIDYSEVQWETPDQDEWLKTMALIEQNKQIQTSAPEPAKSDEVAFDDSIPPIHGVESARSRPLDRDDIEWDF